MGYRESSFDPNAYPRSGPPQRPYNWVQWTGVALGSIGVVLVILYFAGRFGWTPEWIDHPAPAMAPLFLGSVLINSRRQQLASDPRSPSRRTLTLIAIALAAFAGGLALFLYFQGA